LVTTAAPVRPQASGLRILGVVATQSAKEATTEKKYGHGYGTGYGDQPEAAEVQQPAGNR
jgi:hypothetical protein